jgi:acyl carrier protein
MSPNPTSVTDQVRAIVAEQLGVDLELVKADASFIDDLGADSLAIVELVLALEERFHLQIPESETEKLRTVADAVAFIEQRAAA